MAWELGGGGHLCSLAALAAPLTAAGHRVELISRSVEAAHRWRFASATEAGLRAAPALRTAEQPRPERTWPDIVLNAAWTGDVAARLQAWEASLTQGRPEVVVADYAPTAVLAARNLGIRCVTLATSIGRPPTDAPPADLRRMAGQDVPPDDLTRGETDALRIVNPLLREPLDRLGHMFRGVGDIRIVYEPLDLFGPRPGTEYLGPLPDVPRDPPAWPDLDGPRVFAYLKPFPALPAVLKLLEASGLPCVVLLSGAKAKAPAANLRFVGVGGAVDLDRAAMECDLAIGHAGPGMAVTMLRRGRPMLLVPLQLEQALTAKRVTDLGAGVSLRPDDGVGLRDALATLLTDESYARNAAAFARSVAHLHPRDALARAVAMVTG